jgi:prevent-host-death family protein
MFERNSMTAVVNVQEAKTHFSRLVERAHAGEEIVLAKAGKAYARLVPLKQPSAQRRPGRLKGHLGAEFFEPLAEQDLALWDGSEAKS